MQKERKIMRHKPLITLALGAVLLLGLSLALAPRSSEASPLPLPTRPEDAPAGGGDDGGGDKDDQPVGAHIELHVSGAMEGTWTVVQWQDDDGNWHDIEQWWGKLDASGRVKWWVAAKDFGTGPFRWQVTEGRESRVLASSEPFDLPGNGGEMMVIEVPLGQ
jgi:hypothetical protein